MADLHAPRLPLDVLEVVGREVTDSFDRRPSNELYTTLVALSSVSTYFRQVVSPCLFDTLVCFGSSHATKLLRILQSPHSTLSPYVLDFELRLPPGWVDVEELPQIFDTLSNLQSLSIDCSTPQKTTISESLRLSLGRIVASGRIQDLSLTGLIDVSCILDSLHPAVHSLTLHGCFSEPSPSPEALQIMENQGILVPKVSTLTLCRSDPCVRRMLAAGQLQNLQDIVVLYGPSCDPSTLNLVVDGCSKTLQKITLGMKALYDFEASSQNLLSMNTVGSHFRHLELLSVYPTYGHDFLYFTCRYLSGLTVASKIETLTVRVVNSDVSLDSVVVLEEKYFLKAGLWDDLDEVLADTRVFGSLRQVVVDLSQCELAGIKGSCEVLAKRIPKRLYRLGDKVSVVVP